MVKFAIDVVRLQTLALPGILWQTTFMRESQKGDSQSGV